MRIFTNIFRAPEIKAAQAAVEEAAYKYPTDAFRLVRIELDKLIRENADDIVRTIRESRGRTPREWVYCQIGNIAGDMLETGEYHIYRGVINPLGPGKDLLAMHDSTCDELVLMKAIDQVIADDQKTSLRRNLNNVG